MNASFYTAARGAMTEQEKMNVISNNMANVNTVGYKTKSSVFMDLLYYNMHSYDRVSTGTGVKLQHTNTDYSCYGFESRDDGGYNYAIEGDGFFMVRNQIDNSISYTRAGNFSLSLHNDGQFYLITDKKKLVLDENQNPIRLVDGELTAKPGIFSFANTNGMESVGSTEFVPVAKNGAPRLNGESRLVENYVELSNVNSAQEISDVVIASRAYSYALKMVATSDEIEQTINGLRS